uniref:Mce/MlaD domain-containing protein n=1 Tax=Polysiphonia sp. TaxID=1967842 RepID=A0A1Z1MT63_9FLOR|nr:hypothetical protein [Polysiphonia sp.]
MSKNCVIRATRKVLNIAAFALILFSLVFSWFNLKTNKGYSLFLEFNDAYGLKQGTSVNFKGVKIGYVDNITIHLNKVIVLLNIKELDVKIPEGSLFEASQVGLFNDMMISITPLSGLGMDSISNHDSIHTDLNIGYFINPNSYIKGYKGVNYDDLLRATTRISQRFDDPRFFKLFYLFLKNCISLSDELIVLTYNVSNFFYLLF